MKLPKLASIIILIASISVSYPVFAQNTDKTPHKTEKTSPKQNTRKKKNTKDQPAVDTTTANAKPAVIPGSIESVIKPGATRADGGIFSVIAQEDRYFLLIPTSVLGRDMLVVNRLSKSAAEMRAQFAGYAGDQIYEAMIRFVMAPDRKKLFLENISTKELPRDTNGEMYQAVTRSNMQPLAMALDIKARNSAKDSVLVDVTDFLNSDNEIVSFDPIFKDVFKLNTFAKERSYISSVSSYPINTEIRMVKTYMATPPSAGPTPAGNTPGTSPKPRPFTFEINSSVILLPEVPMQARYADSRVGYFTEKYIDYDQNPQGVENISMITRWKLEPRAEDIGKYGKGELVEPEKPIVFYIDPATPAKWVPYLIQGVNDWQLAFEAAGFKNAIYALEAPTYEQDSTWSLEDARFSAIVYKPSNIPNASGPHVRDPRSGEIIESHINWYHNVMSLLRNWYMIQAGPNDPRAQKMVFDDELMGQLIRFVSSHEIGHALGLRHNFGASCSAPADSLRNASYLRRNGNGPSIMDYTRFNYVVQPEDKIDPALLMPRIGDYDLWAIEWGYRRFPALTTPQAEKGKLNRWIVDKSVNPRLWFGRENNPNDPRSQSEDLGDNQMKANELGIRNLKRVMAGIPQWTMVPDEGYDGMKTIYNDLVKQYARYMGHAAKWVGGVFETPKSVEQPGDVYEFVPKAKQKEALNFINENLFKTPEWLLDQNIFGKTGLNGPAVINSVNHQLLIALLNKRVMGNMINAETAHGRQNAYTVSEFYGDLNRMVWTELSTGRTPDVYRRMLQKSYVEILISLSGLSTTPAAPAVTPGSNDVASITTAQLRSLLSRLTSAVSSDPAAQAHYRFLALSIKMVLEK